MSSRSPSPMSQRKASSPPAAPSQTSPTAQPPHTTVDSLSSSFLPSSLPELLEVPFSDSLGDSLREVKRMPAVEASASLAKAQFPGNSSSFWEQDMWSRSTQTELENESGTATETTATMCDTSDQNEEPRYTLQRMTGSSWSPNTFLASLIVLSVIVFTLAVITTIFGTANSSKKLDNMELYHAVEDKPAVAHEDVELTTTTTRMHTRKVVTSVRRKAASKMHSTRAASGSARKVTRSSSRRLKSTTQGSDSLFSTSLPSNHTERTSPQQLSSTATVRQPSSSAAGGRDNVPRRGHLRADLRTELSDPIIASVDDNVIAVGPEDYSVASSKRTSRAPSTSPDDSDVEEVI